MAKSIYPIEIEALGITIPLEGGWTPSNEDIWEAIKVTVPPEDMFSAYERGEKEFVRNAYRNDYFKGAPIGEALEHVGELGKSGVTGVYRQFGASLEGASLRRKHGQAESWVEGVKIRELKGPWGEESKLRGVYTYKNEKGQIRDLVDHAESLEKGGIYLHGLLESDQDPDKAMDLAIKRSGMGWWPNQKDVKKWIAQYQGLYEGDKTLATAYKSAGNIIYGYPMMGEMGGAFISQAWLDDEEQIDNWIETYAKVNELEKGRQRSARQVALTVGDVETFMKLRAGDVAPDEGIAFLGEIVADPANLGGLFAAKAVMAPVRATLTGMARKQVIELQKELMDQAAEKALVKTLGGNRLTGVGWVSGEASEQIAKSEAILAKLNESIAARTETLRKYGGHGFVGRLAGSPVSVLAAEEALDLTKEAGRAASKITRGALAPRPPKTLVSQLAGRGMQVLGAPMEWAGRLGLFLKAIPENAALTAIQKVTAKELTEQEAKSILLKLTATGGGVYAYLEGEDAMPELLGGLAAYFGPRALATVGRDIRVIGNEVALARATDPFFRTLGALPTPAEGLAGAAVDRTNPLTQGWWSATKAAATDPAKRSILGTGAGLDPYVSGLTKGVSRFLDTTGLGRPLEGAGRFGGAMAEGALLPAGIGYVGAGGDPTGAVVGGAISAPFTFVGAGLGKLANFKNRGELARKQLGDVEHYRERLTPDERKEFDALSMEERMVLSSTSLSYPDLIIEAQSLGKKGGSGHHRVREDGSVMVYNKDTETPLRHVGAHEGSHHLETHGLTGLVNRIMFGDPDLGIAGVYVKRTEDGKPVYLRDADGEFILHPETKRKQWELSDDFRKLKEDYMERLRRTHGVSAKEMQDYEKSPEKLGREIFAEHGADLQLTGKLQKHLDKGPIGKLLATTAKVIFPESFTKSLMLKLGVPIDKDGRVVGTGIFKNLQRIPELDAIIKKYKRDTAGKRKGEIEEAFPVSEDYGQSFSVEDQSNPVVRDLMNTGGIFKYNEADGSLVLDSMGNPKRMTKGQMKKQDEAASAHVLGVLERHGVEIETVTGKDGVEKKSATFKNLTEEMIDELAEGPFHSRQIEALRRIAGALRDGDGQEAGFLLGYFAASKSGRPQALPYRVRKAFPYEFEVTQGGNIMIKLLDPGQLEKNLKFLRKDKRFLRWANLFENDNRVWDDLRIYTANQVAGRPGSTGLGADKANFLNALLGGMTKAQVELNPILKQIGWTKASAKSSRAPFSRAIRSFRLDRVFSAERSGEGMLFDYNRAEQLRMPRMEDETVPLPFIEDLGGEEPAAGFKRVATQKMRKADFERFQKPLSRAAAQEAMGNQSQVQPFQPRFPRGEERQFMPAGEPPPIFRTERGMEPMSERMGLIRTDVRAVQREGKWLPKEVLAPEVREVAVEALAEALTSKPKVKPGVRGAKKRKRELATQAKVAGVWKAIAESDEVFQLGSSGSRQIKRVADDVTGGKLSVFREVLEGGGRTEEVITLQLKGPPKEIGETLGHVRASVITNKEPRLRGIGRPEGVVHVTSIEAGKGSGLGTLAYQTILTWVNNNGYKYHPENLTVINKLRATSQQLSNALKHRTTQHFTPAPEQGVFGWGSKPSDYDTNVALLALREMDFVYGVHELETGGLIQFPELRDIRYDFTKGEFYKIGDSGNRVPIDEGRIRDIISRSDPDYEAGVGAATAKRAIVTRTIAESAKDRGRLGDASGRPSVPGGLEGTLYMPAEGEGAGRSYRGAAPTARPRSVILSDANLKSLEGDKQAVQAKLTIADYPDNPNPNSVALPARAGLVNPKIAGMPRTYADVRTMVETQVGRILDIAKKKPEFAKRSANFYGDMAESALNLADAAKVPDRSLYDVADLQLRFLSLGSPRSSVPANSTKSSRSIMAPHGEVAGYKINPGSQQKGAMLTAKDWDKGGHFDVMNPDLPGAADKVRNFYLNGLAELIDVAVARGDKADAAMLRDRAARTLGLLKGKQRMTKKVEGKLEKFFDGLATVDMWDMAAKGYAHPAYVPPGKGRGQTQNAPFQWSVPKHRVKAKTKGRIWERALQDMEVESLGDLNYQQARALQIDGRKDWNTESWARWLGELEQLAEEGGPLTLAEEMGSMEPFLAQIDWSYYKKADEAGLNPGGKGPLYDAHQTIDGLIADSLNEAGMAEFFGKKKLTARNAQEILWAIEKLDNPLPANQRLVLFGDRITPFYEAIQILRETGMKPEEMPKSARQIFDAIRDTYAKASTQSIPLEVSTWGTTPRAQAIQAQEAAMGARRLTESVARNLREDIQRIADQHEVEIVIDEVKLGDGGYEEGGVAYVSPNISVTLRGDPVNTSRVMRALSLVWDQDGGNLIRKPTIEELNAGKKLNKALVFDTKAMTSAQKSAFFLELNALKDAKGDSFLTGFTETQDGMFIGDQFYSGNLLTEYAANKATIDAIIKKHGVKDVDANEVVIETFHRLDPEVSSQFPKVVRDSFTRDLYRMAHDRIGTAQARKPSKATQTLNQVQRIREQSAEVVGKEFPSDSAKTKAKNDMLSQVDLLYLREGITERGAAALKNQVKANFEQARVRSREGFGRTQAKTKKSILKTISDETASKRDRREALWAMREEFTPTQFENRMKKIMTEEQKSIELIPGRFRAKSGVKLPRSFQEPQQTGRWQRK